MPSAVRQRNLELISREIRKNNHTLTFKKLGTSALRLLAAALVLIALFGCAYAISPRLRAGTLNLLMQLDEKATSFQLGQDDYDERPHLSPVVSVKWLPDGYVSEPPIADRLQTTVNCVNEQDDTIRIRVFTDDQTAYTLDSEEADFCEDVTIQGHPAMLVEKKGSLRIVWADDASDTFIYIVADNLDRADLIQMAEGISVSW